MGGAAGHMAHPFDLGWVNSGSDLLDFFEKAKTFVEKKGSSAVKIDGVNVSFKVVGDDENKQFAVDRGSLKPIDIEGITMNRVDDRFPEGHGMRPAIRTLLTILNTSLPDIRKELEVLGMLNDPSRFLNTEYVEGTTNVTEYDENFLAIHGLSQFYHKIAKSGPSKGNIRPGLERPEGVKAPSVEVLYEPQTMESLIKKLNSVAQEYGFQVYGSVPTEKMNDIDFSETLSTPLTVRISDDREITKSLKEWLLEATNPRYKTVKLKNGTKVHALHKQLYIDILNGNIPIVDLIEDADAEAAIYGAVLMHATRMLGNDVLRALTSPMGDVMSHEGIVMRDEKLFGPNPVKITGEFIVGNLGSGFGQVNEEEDEIEDINIDLKPIEDEDTDPPDEFTGERPPQTIAIVPGAFKPPTRGHLGMVEEYADRSDEVIVLISRPTLSGRYITTTLPNGKKVKREITASDSKKIWEVMVSHLLNVKVEISSHASPLTAAYEFIGKDGPLPQGATIILGASTKTDSKGRADWQRWNEAAKYVKGGIMLAPPESTAVEPTVHSAYYMDLLSQSPLQEEMPSISSGKDPNQFHASDMRYLLGKVAEDEEAVELLEDFTGEDNIFDVLAILGLNIGLNEISGAGAVAGPSGPLGTPRRRGRLETKGEEEEQLNTPRKENVDLSMVDDVMRLIMERGILR